MAPLVSGGLCNLPQASIAHSQGTSDKKTSLICSPAACAQCCPSVIAVHCGMLKSQHGLSHSSWNSSNTQNTWHSIMLLHMFWELADCPCLLCRPMPVGSLAPGTKLLLQQCSNACTLQPLSMHDTRCSCLSYWCSS